MTMPAAPAPPPPSAPLDPEVAALLDRLDLQAHAPAFAAQRITAGLLDTLREDDLQALGMVALGDRRRLLLAVAARRRSGGRPWPAVVGLAALGTGLAALAGQLPNALMLEDNWREPLQWSAFAGLAVAGGLSAWHLAMGSQPPRQGVAGLAAALAVAITVALVLPGEQFLVNVVPYGLCAAVLGTLAARGRPLGTGGALLLALAPIAWWTLGVQQMHTFDWAGLGRSGALLQRAAAGAVVAAVVESLALCLGLAWGMRSRAGQVAGS